MTTITTLMVIISIATTLVVMKVGMDLIKWAWLKNFRTHCARSEYLSIRT